MFPEDALRPAATPYRQLLCPLLQALFLPRIGVLTSAAEDTSHGNGKIALYF